MRVFLGLEADRSRAGCMSQIALREAGCVARRARANSTAFSSAPRTLYRERSPSGNGTQFPPTVMIRVYFNDSCSGRVR